MAYAVVPAFATLSRGRPQMLHGDAAVATRLMDRHLDAIIGRALIAPPPANRDIGDILGDYAAE